jgi:hypothetical protein
MYIAEFSPSSSFIDQTVGDKSEIIQILPLDSYIEQIRLYKNILCKIDVEGFELEVLKGSNESLKYIKYLYVECRLEEDKIGCSFDDIYQYLTSRNWRYAGNYDTTINNIGKISHFDSLFINDSI